MIWRCECGHKVSRHDEPRAGQRTLYCIPCRASTVFTLHPEDQPVRQVHAPKRNRYERLYGYTGEGGR